MPVTQIVAVRIVTGIAILAGALLARLASKIAKEKVPANGSAAGGATVVAGTDGQARPSDNPFSAKKSTACTLF